jgi:hypothetical protein
MTTFVPKDFEVPAGFETPDFRVRMLAISDVVKDYDAVMTSVQRLQKVFSPSGRWPKGLTFEQDLVDLGWHHKEFQMRRSFAYTVMSLDEALCWGASTSSRPSCAAMTPRSTSGSEPAMPRRWTPGFTRRSGIGLDRTGRSRPSPILDGR